MANYYFLATLLPRLQIGEPPEISFDEFDQLLSDNLSASDYAKTSTIRNFYDIYNLRSYWKGEPLDHAGNFNSSELEEAMVTRTMLPPYVFQFLDKYESKEERLRHFPELLSTFYKIEVSRSTGFLKAYLMLERELRLVLVAFRTKKLDRDLLKELQYEDPEEEIIAQIIAQKDASQYEPPPKFEEIKFIFEKYSNDPIEIQKALAEFRFYKIEEMLGLDMFSIDRILGYMAQLLIVERWQHLNKQKGKEIVDSMLKDIS